MVRSFGLMSLLRQYRKPIAITWGLVLIENILLALIPLMTGRAIDDLLAGGVNTLFVLAGVLVVLTLLMVMRRIYDTRAYGKMRVGMGLDVRDSHIEQLVSIINARLNMARELVDFLEEQIPELITACVQIVIALIVLASFHQWLALSVFSMSVAVFLIYTLFHGKIYRLNSLLNGQSEKQVSLLQSGRKTSLLRHLRLLNKHEISLSDTDAVVYGLIFLVAVAAIIFNLWIATQVMDVTAGSIFSIVSYSWEFVQAVFMLPLALQSLTRLKEISDRLNSNQKEDDLSVGVMYDNV